LLARTLCGHIVQYSCCQYLPSFLLMDHTTRHYFGCQSPPHLYTSIPLWQIAIPLHQYSRISLYDLIHKSYISLLADAYVAVVFSLKCFHKFEFAAKSNSLLTRIIARESSFDILSTADQLKLHLLELNRAKLE
jgi:hypothetical protein